MAKIEGAFEQIDRRLRRVEAELVSLRTDLQRQISAVREELKGEINSVGEDVRSLYRMTLSVLIPMWVTPVGAIIGIALTHCFMPRNVLDELSWPRPRLKITWGP